MGVGRWGRALLSQPDSACEDVAFDSGVSYFPTVSPHYVRLPTISSHAPWPSTDFSAWQI